MVDYSKVEELKKQQADLELQIKSEQAKIREDARLESKRINTVFGFKWDDVKPDLSEAQAAAVKKRKATVKSKAAV